jgi:hypothetical protein
MEKSKKTYSLDELANVVVDLYKNQQLKRCASSGGSTFRGRGRGGREIGKGPNASNKSRQAEHTETIRRIWVHESLSVIPNYESLESLLKKAAMFRFVASNNNIKIDVKELREVIDVLKIQIANLVQQNNESLGDEIHKKEQELQVLEATLKKKSMDQYNSETVMEDFNGIAINVLEILHKNDNVALQLYDLIRTKLIPQEKSVNTKTTTDSHRNNGIFNNSYSDEYRQRPRHGHDHSNSHFENRSRFQNSHGFRPRNAPTKEQYEPRYIPPHLKSHFDKNKSTFNNGTDKKYVQSETLPSLESLPVLQSESKISKPIGAWAVPLSQKIFEQDKNKEMECKDKNDNENFKKHFLKEIIQVEDNDVKSDNTHNCEVQRQNECKPMELNWNVDNSEW